MYVIVKTTNEYRGEDAVLQIIGPYATEEAALAVNDELRAELPDGYEHHWDNPVDYTVLQIDKWAVLDGAAMRVA